MTTQSTHLLKGAWNARNLLTVLEVAEWARVHPKTVYRWIGDGKLEAIQFGPRTFRVPEDAIGKFLNKNGYGKTAAVRKSTRRDPLHLPGCLLLASAGGWTGARSSCFDRSGRQLGLKTGDPGCFRIYE